MIADVARVFVTRISTTPDAWAGEVTSSWESDVTRIDVPGVVPNATAVVPRNPVPVIVTVVPPLGDPAAGATPVTVSGR